MKLINKFFKHLATITKHKFLVMKYCFKSGIIWRGLLHDNSKYSPIEFFESVKYYQGTSSPNYVAKKYKGYSMAWLHHRGNNPHHWEYWLDSLDNCKNTTIIMPIEYVYEMICDWIGSGKTYHGKTWTQQAPYNFFCLKKDTMILNPKTEILVENIVSDMAKEGLDYTCRKMRRKEYNY